MPGGMTVSGNDGAIVTHCFISISGVGDRVGNGVIVGGYGVGVGLFVPIGTGVALAALTISVFLTDVVEGDGNDFEGAQAPTSVANNKKHDIHNFDINPLIRP